MLTKKEKARLDKIAKEVMADLDKIPLTTWNTPLTTCPEKTYRIFIDRG
jgi:hypothetical protein